MLRLVEAGVRVLELVQLPGLEVVAVREVQFPHLVLVFRESGLAVRLAVVEPVCIGFILLQERHELLLVSDVYFC